MGQEEPQGYSLPGVDVVADSMLAVGLVTYVTSPIVNAFSGLCKSKRPEADLEPHEFTLKVSGKEVVLALLGRSSDTSIRELLSDGSPEVIIDNIKNLFPHTSDKVANAIAEKAEGKRILLEIYNRTIEAMGLTQSRDRKTITGTLHRNVTKDDLIQMIITTRTYGLEHQANALEKYAISLSDSRKVTKREILAKVQELAKQDLTKI